MKRTKFTDEQIAFTLRNAETGTRVGASAPDVLLINQVRRFF